MVICPPDCILPMGQLFYEEGCDDIVVCVGAGCVLISKKAMANSSKLTHNRTRPTRTSFPRFHFSSSYEFLWLTAQLSHAAEKSLENLWSKISLSPGSIIIMIVTGWGEPLKLFPRALEW